MDEVIGKREAGVGTQGEDREPAAAAAEEEAYRLACRRYARLSGRRR